jgi:hypothetical protein
MTCTVKSKIYVNSAAVGVEKSSGCSAAETESDDITGVVAGDLIQLYVKGNTASDVGANGMFALCVATPIISAPYFADMAGFSATYYTGA